MKDHIVCPCDLTEMMDAVHKINDQLLVLSALEMYEPEHQQQLNDVTFEIRSSLCQIRLALGPNGNSQDPDDSKLIY